MQYHISQRNEKSLEKVSFNSSNSFFTYFKFNILSGERSLQIIGILNTILFCLRTKSGKDFTD
jgi:hypothetical protein